MQANKHADTNPRSFCVRICTGVVSVSERMSSFAWREAESARMWFFLDLGLPCSVTAASGTAAHYMRPTLRRTLLTGLRSWQRTFGEIAKGMNACARPGGPWSAYGSMRSRATWRRLLIA